MIGHPCGWPIFFATCAGPNNIRLLQINMANLAAHHRYIDIILRENLMLFRILFAVSIYGMLIAPTAAQSDSHDDVAVKISGKHAVWQRITIDIMGPMAREQPSTFRDIRADISFTHVDSNQSLTIPAYFAADGNAAQSSASQGSIWRAIFVADKAGLWRWTTSFRRGKDVAISHDPNAGRIDRKYHGKSGSFMVSDALKPATKDAHSFAAKGRITLSDSHYPKHTNGDIFFKTGAGSPENILAYTGFDGTIDAGGTHFPALGDNQLHEFAPHIGDWNVGDPDWQNGRGKAIIGAINYLSGVGVNAQYFVAMNVEGDGQDVWPWIGADDFYTFDVSKLEQWQIVMNHMDDRGLVKDFLFTETENESLFEHKEGTDFFAASRKLYYREMIARFGHALGLTWNLSEEIGVIGNSGESPWRDPTTAAQRAAFIDYISKLDAYNHPIVMHNWPDGEDAIYQPVLGKNNFSGISMQAHEDYAERIIKWRNASAEAGRKWMIAVDEPLGWEFGARPDTQTPDHDMARTTVLWPLIMAGGAGVDWYFGWQNNAPTSDLSNEDMRSRDALWKQSRIARELITDWPLDDMQPRPDLGHDILAQNDKFYAVYMADGLNRSIDLSADIDANLLFTITYYNPKTGQILGMDNANGGDIIILQSPDDPKANNADRLAILSR